MHQLLLIVAADATLRFPSTDDPSTPLKGYATIASGAEGHATISEHGSVAFGGEIHQGGLGN